MSRPSGGPCRGTAHAHRRARPPPPPPRRGACMSSEWFVLSCVSGLQRHRVGACAGPGAGVPFFLVRRDGVETPAPVAPVAFRQDTARRQYGRAPGGLTGPLLCRWQDRWLKSWCPSGDVIARVTSLPRVDLIKRIVPAGRLRFICLLILTCLHKLSPWSRASLLITVNRTPRAVPGPVRVPSAGSTVILNEPASPGAVSCTPALCAKWEGSCLSRIRSTVGSKAGEL